MTFQFLCPQGHLLEGDEAHMGMQCECPQCGTAFIIPTIGPGGHPSSPGPAAATPEIELEPIAAPDELSEPDDAAGYDAPYGAEAAPTLEEGSAGGRLEDVGDAAIGVEEPLLHIPCPNGHELETPLDMIGQRVMCPHCGAEFRLRREKSREYIRQQEILERRRAKFWFQLAVLAAGFVGVVLLAMIVISALR